MTTNRARKRAARAIAAEKGIRYPEAFAAAYDKVEPNERPRPREMTLSDDPNDPQLARRAAELNNSLTGLVLAPGVIGSGMSTEKMCRLVSHANGTDEAAEGTTIDQSDLQKVRIVFARRYADMVAAGLDPMRALDLMREGLRSFPAAESIVEVIPAIRTQLGMGYTAAEAWRPHLELLGIHLYQMLTLSESVGWSPTPFRDAANTMESELRLGDF